MNAALERFSSASRKSGFPIEKIFDLTPILSIEILRINEKSSLFFYFLLQTRLPVTRWVKVSLNFEFLVPK